VVPLYPVLPVIFCATCAYMFYSTVTYSYTVHGVWSLIGLAVLAAGVPFMLMSDSRRDIPGSPGGFDPIAGGPAEATMES
jgi:basic amino acid/polyamine antiporter, APA family